MTELNIIFVMNWVSYHKEKNDIIKQKQNTHG